MNIDLTEEEANVLETLSQKIKPKPPALFEFENATVRIYEPYMVVKFKDACGELSFNLEGKTAYITCHTYFFKLGFSDSLYSLQFYLNNLRKEVPFFLNALKRVCQEVKVS